MDLLLFGQDLKVKDQALADIKAKLFSSPDAARLETESLDGHKLTPEKLKIALLSLPGAAPRRLVHISRAEKLPKDLLEMLTSFLKAPHPHVVVVLDAEVWDGSAKMRSELDKLLVKKGVQAPEPASVFQMMDEVSAGHTSGALLVLTDLFKAGEAPEKLMGGVLWAWSNKIKGRVSAQAYKKGLLVLQEADMALKRSRFPEREYALEVAVVKLSSIVKPPKA